MLRRVIRETVVAFSAPRTLLMQAAHPVAFAGFFAHTGSLDDPYARLRRTAEVMDLVAWGPREEADAATARVRAVHAKVRGVLAEDAGPWPAGTPYAADDPELLLWILATLMDSASLVYGRYVARLSPVRARRAVGRLPRRRPPVRPGRRRDAGRPRGVPRLHARDAALGRPARDRRGARARDPHRVPPAGAARGHPAARARQPVDDRLAAADAAPPVPASSGTRCGRRRCAGAPSR